MRYRLQRHDGTDCSATMVPITVLRMVPIQRYRHIKVVTLNSNRNSNPKLKITTRKGIKKGSHKLPNQHSKK